MKEILFYFYRTKLIGINMETNNLLAPLFFVLIGLMGGAILKFGLKRCLFLTRSGYLPLDY